MRGEYHMIGILTLSSAENYGAVLQCHSLCEYIKQKNVPAEIIDYVPSFIIGRYKWITIDKSGIYSTIRSLIGGTLKLPIVCIKKYRFYYFRKNFSHYSKKQYIGMIDEDNYDCYIIGSDQVWNLELTNYDLNFFLPFCNDSKKKNSYAASIGVDKINDKAAELYKKFLPSFNHISVREQQAVEILNRTLENRTVCKNIDPVFLHDKKYWAGLSSKRIIKEKYVLIYAFVEISTAIQIAEKMAGNSSIYFLNNELISPKKGIKNVRCVGPLQFLSLVRDAEYVVTDSFHGMAFSIIFNKQFCVIPYKGTSSRMLNVLQQFDLTDRLLHDNQCDANVIDYEKVNTKIKALVLEADSYLDSIIKEVK